MNPHMNQSSSQKWVAPIPEETKQKLIRIASEDACSNMKKIIELLYRPSWENVLADVEILQIYNWITWQLYVDKWKNAIRREALELLTWIRERRQKIATLGLRLN